MSKITLKTLKLIERAHRKTRKAKTMVRWKRMKMRE